MGLTAIGIQHTPSEHEDLFRVRVKGPGNTAWRAPDGGRDCCAGDAARVLVALGLSDERARHLIDAALTRGTEAAFQH